MWTISRKLADNNIFFRQLNLIFISLLSNANRIRCFSSIFVPLNFLFDAVAVSCMFRARTSPIKTGKSQIEDAIRLYIIPKCKKEALI